jgi:hypothetical protein
MVVMKKFTTILFLWVVLNSCFLSKYKRTNFTYSEGSQSYSIPIVVPKGFAKERTEVDSSGNTILSYFYEKKAGKAFFYIAHMVDSSTQLQPIIEEEHIPQVRLGTETLVYKGLDKENLYWREVRKGELRVGYHSVPKHLESRFDSATNYAIVHPLK